MSTVTQRDRGGWQGRGQIHAIRYRRGELVRDRAGKVREAPACYGLEHRGGVCPAGYRHDVDERHAGNTVLDAWYAAILDLAGDVAGGPDLGIQYVSGGTGAAATAPSDAALGAEVWRDEWTDRDQGTPTEQTHYFHVPEGAIVALFHEWGAWANNPTATPGSGLLVARWLIDYDMSADVSINGQWTLAKA